jgi:acetoin utilization protein AcuB
MVILVLGFSSLLSLSAYSDPRLSFLIPFPTSSVPPNVQAKPVKLKYLPLASDKMLRGLPMPIIRAVNGIVETYPAAPVTPRPPATQADADSRDRSKHQGRRTADHATHLAQQAYQQQVGQDPAPKPALHAQDIMTSPVTCLPSDSTLLEAWTVMRRKGIHHLPVTSVHGTLVGMVSIHDLLPYAHELEAVNSPGPSVAHKLASVMSNRVLSATPTTEIREIAHVMLDEQVNAIPILDSSRRPIGILTTSDILRAIVHRSPLDLRT